MKTMNTAKTMQCDECDVEMIEREATREVPYAYALSGLKDVYLSGITILKCPTCGAEAPIIPRVAELHRLIADMIVNWPAPLIGDKVRFLRKHAGFSATEFAVLLGVDPSHLSRVENGHTQHLGRPADRLARTLAMVTDGDAARERLIKVSKLLAATRDPKPAPRPFFKMEKNRWMPAAA
jgi:transcriptional regulator with XRE-family HTH domain